MTDTNAGRIALPNGLEWVAMDLEKGKLFDKEGFMCGSLRRDVAEMMAGKIAWQDISTAPKDGTRIVLYMPHNQERWHVITGFWFEDEETATGYWEMSKSNHFNYKPTHWQPLPPAPTGDAK